MSREQHSERIYVDCVLLCGGKISHSQLFAFVTAKRKILFNFFGLVCNEIILKVQSYDNFPFK